MKKNIHFKRTFNYFIISLAALFSVFLFQAQDTIDENDPGYERPTRESMSHFRPPNMTFPSTVTINDFDNFEMGINNYEQHATSNPLNPLWIFFGVNGGSPMDARGTTDGGLNWYLSDPTYPSGTCCDPWTTYTGSGVLIYGTLHTSQGQHVYRSTNNGLTWSSPVLSAPGVDRNHVSAEYTGNGPYANYVYAALTPGNFGRSTDAGVTWQTTFNPSNSLPGCYIAVGPNGAIDGGCVMYVTNTGSDNGNRIYNFYRSTNGGANFTLMSSQSGWAGYVGFYTGSRHTINNARTAPHPKMAMDNSNGPYRGRLYFVNASNDPPGNGNKPDIWLRYSDDQGASFSPPVRVNDNANPTASDQWFPEIWCERTTGRLYLHWYDDREGPATFQTSIYATYTNDGGQTFAPNQRIGNTVFPFPNPPCSPNCYKGDYTSITANNPICAFSIWSDHRNATALNMGAYFPDFAMRVLPNSDTLRAVNDSTFSFVTVPGVKLWNRSTKFSATVSPTPSTGTFNFTFLHKSNNINIDSMMFYPDSIRIRTKITSISPDGLYTVTVKGNGPNGTPVHVRTITFLVTTFLSVVNNQVPAEFSLMQNYPNPFNPATTIQYSIVRPGQVKIVVYDISGREVETLLNGKSNAGTFEIKWDASNKSSGVYFYKITAGDFTDTKKMLFVK
ncbi:MAG TPA: T9SS type A sorting domain-containing protein [Ignavibacteria bacterium]|nr:T9SS type A sorting domain-containing protein [Ignavibacteria bacterium]